MEHVALHEQVVEFFAAIINLAKTFLLKFIIFVKKQTSFQNFEIIVKYNVRIFFLQVLAVPKVV